MTTKSEIIKLLKAENPTLKIGSDQDGYQDLTVAEYEEQISEWADARLAKEALNAESDLAAKAKLEAIEKLTALGIDPKALGL